MTNLLPVDYDGQQIRMVKDSDGAVRFVLADLCAVLDLTNPTMVASRLHPDDLSTTEVIDSMGRTQTARTVNESGMNDLIIESRKPEAREIRRWLTREVMPSIRETGAYGTPRMDPSTIDRRALARMVIEAEDARELAEAKVAQLEPSAAAGDHLASTDGDYDVNHVSKILSRDPAISIGERRLWTWMDQNRWTYRGSDGKRRAYQAQVDNDRLAERAQSHHHPRTGELILDPPQVRVTVKGIADLHRKLGGTEALDLDGQPQLALVAGEA